MYLFTLVENYIKKKKKKVKFASTYKKIYKNNFFNENLPI